MTYSQWFIKQNLLCETPYFMGELAWKHQQDIINRLQMALADTDALEAGTAEKVKQLQAQLESEKVSHAAWEKQSLLEYSEIVQERDAFESDISTIAQHNIELMQERDALRDALIEIKEWTERYTQPGHPIVTFADKALAKLKEE